MQYVHCSSCSTDTQNQACIIGLIITYLIHGKTWKKIRSCTMQMIDVKTLERGYCSFNARLLYICDIMGEH